MRQEPTVKEALTKKQLLAATAEIGQEALNRGDIVESLKYLERVFVLERLIWVDEARAAIELAAEIDPDLPLTARRDANEMVLEVRVAKVAEGPFGVRRVPAEMRERIARLNTQLDGVAVVKAVAA